MFKNFTLADALKKALMLIAQAVERCHQLLFTVNKDNSMWSRHLHDLPAFWRHISHNSRNNIRTKAKRKK